MGRALLSNVEITHLLSDYKQGTTGSFDRLMKVIYPELKRLARLKLGGSGAPTLSPTALVHEAYIKLMGSQPADWHDRAHFFAAMSRIMRHVLVDYARSKQTAKRHRDPGSETDEEAPSAGGDSETMVAIGVALDRLEARDAAQARVFESRYFGGLSTDETAGALGLSKRTVERHWQAAKAFLAQEMEAKER